MEFVGGLSRTKREHHYLYVVADTFSKKCVLMACNKTIKGKEVTSLFFERMFMHFGITRSIISNKDIVFFSVFWTSLCKTKVLEMNKSPTFVYLSDSVFWSSIAFHPQTDG
jgi:hypothetical protein